MNEVRLKNFINGGYCLFSVAIITLILSYFYFSAGLYDRTVSTGLLFRLDYGTAGVGSFLLNLLLVGACTFLIFYLNKRFAFIREYTLIHTSYFLLLTAGIPSLVAVFNPATLFGIGILAAMTALYGGYQQTQSRSTVFLITTMLSFGSMYNYALLFLLPVFIVGFFQMQIFGFKSFLAMLFGLVTPYWIVLGFGICELSEIVPPQLDFSADGYLAIIKSPLLLNIILTIACGTAFSAVNLFRLMSYKLQLRSYNGFITILAMAVTVLLFIDINNIYLYLTILNICLAFHAAHFFTIENFRRSYILFIALALINICGWLAVTVVKYLL